MFDYQSNLIDEIAKDYYKDLSANLEIHIHNHHDYNFHEYLHKYLYLILHLINIQMHDRVMNYEFELFD